MKFSPIVAAAFCTRQGRESGSVSTSSSSSSRLQLVAIHHAPEPISITSERVLLVPQTSTSNLNSEIANWIQTNLLVPPASAAETAAPPSKEEIKLLRDAFSVFYGVDRDPAKAEQLLSQAIEAWQRQPPDEKAGLYRVRGDCYMALLRPSDAEKDYGEAVRLLQGPGGDLADEAELPAALLGRARSIRSQGSKVSTQQAETAAKDYRLSLRLSAREDWDTDQEREEDGAMRNPFAAWEWGRALRVAGDYVEAARVHTLASEYFEDIGDKARSVISALDAGVDLAATGNSDTAIASLKSAIKRTTTVEGRDVALLQRVIAKEGEGRMALASVLWASGERVEAEAQLGKACSRLDQLEVDAQVRAKSMGSLLNEAERLKFNIDDSLGAFEMSCSRFKNTDFLTDKLEWPAALQQKVYKLENLGK